MYSHNNSLKLILCSLAICAFPAVAQQPPDSVSSDVYQNTAMGANALLNLTPMYSDGIQYGGFNTAAGAEALYSNTLGYNNSAFGNLALYYNISGIDNTAVGYQALYENAANYNTAVGSYALDSNTTGDLNTAVGENSMYNNDTGSQNSAFGWTALYTNTTGNRNNASGEGALYSNTTASDNNAMGVDALHDNTTGTLNNAMGNYALEYNTTGNNNNAVGYGSLLYNTTGADNSAQGYDSLGNNTSGSLNIGVGYKAGVNLTTGKNNIDIGNAGVAAESGMIRIGIQGTQSAAFIAGIFGGGPISGGSAVLVSASGQLGVVSSSRRYKEDIQPMGEESERLYQLRPVTFRYRQPNADGAKPIQVGLIAEDVAEVLPELVVYNNDGQPESVAYHLLPTLLLNELQKEHRQVKEQSSELEQARTLIQAQARQLKAQEARTAELSVQVAELKEVTTQLVAWRNKDRTGAEQSAVVAMAR